MDFMRLKIFWLLCLLSLCFLGSCRMTEKQIRSIPPQLMTPDLSTKSVETETDQTPRRLPFGLVFAGLALLIGAVVYLKSDQKMPVEPPDLPRKKVKRVSQRTKNRKKS